MAPPAKVLRLEEKELKQGLLGLVMALVEIIRDVLRHQALRRVEGGSLSPEEIERVGRALKELDEAIAQIKEELGVAEAVRSVREGLDEVVERLLIPWGDGAGDDS